MLNIECQVNGEPSGEIDCCAYNIAHINTQLDTQQMAKIHIIFVIRIFWMRASQCIFEQRILIMALAHAMLLYWDQAVLCSLAEDNRKRHNIYIKCSCCCQYILSVNWYAVVTLFPFLLSNGVEFSLLCKLSLQMSAWVSIMCAILHIHEKSQDKLIFFFLYAFNHFLFLHFFLSFHFLSFILTMLTIQYWFDLMWCMLYDDNLFKSIHKTVTIMASRKIQLSSTKRTHIKWSNLKIIARQSVRTGVKK